MQIDYKSVNRVLTNEELDVIYDSITSGKELYVHFYNLPTVAEVARYTLSAGKHGLEGEYDSLKDLLTIRCSDREALSRYYNNTATVADGKNRMGCSESWYDPYYAISQTFTADEVAAMQDKEVANLIKLAENIQESLY